MSKLKVGSVCSGYGGLDMAVESAFGGELAWFFEYEKAPSRVLAHHWPTVPNHGDLTKANWGGVEPVGVLCGGTPCQDLSGAGRRAGMTEGTRSNLWVQMREGIAVLRPQFVVWENVRGALSAYAVSEVESESGLLGESYGPDRPALRALNRVLGDLSDLGYDTQWCGVRASDAGAPHNRFRVFVLAHAVGFGRREGWTKSAGRVGRLAPVVGGRLATDADRSGRIEHGWPVTVQPKHTTTEHGSATATDAASGGRDGRAQDTIRGTVERVATARGGLDIVTDTKRIGGERWGGHHNLASTSGTGEADRRQRERDGDAADNRGTVDWGNYGPAIHRWERVIGRVAPSPTENTGKDGQARLSPPFVEWMMGLPAGHVTDPVIGLTRNEQLKALGNGVVPQQAELAIGRMLSRIEVAA